MRHAANPVAPPVGSARTAHFLHDLYLFTPLILLVSVLPSAFFYTYNNGWEWSTSIFYSVQVIMGELYGIPAEPKSNSQMFTLTLFLWGNLITFGAIGSFSSRFFYDTIKEERKRVRYDDVQDFNYDGLINYKDYIIYYFNNFLYEIGWEMHKPKYVTFSLCLFWIAVGFLYGSLVEGMTNHEALYFSVGMISCSGLPAPLCEGPSASDCSLRPDLAIFMAFYIVIGVPLYTFTLGQFSGLIIQKAVHFTEARVLTRPLKEIEFQAAILLCKRKITASSESGLSTQTSIQPSSQPSHQNSVKASQQSVSPRPPQVDAQAQAPARVQKDHITLAEFLTLELIRLKRVDAEDIAEICELFHEIDAQGRGYLDIAEMLEVSEQVKDSFSDRPHDADLPSSAPYHVAHGNYIADSGFDNIIENNSSSLYRSEREREPLLAGIASRSAEKSQGISTYSTFNSGTSPPSKLVPPAGNVYINANTLTMSNFNRLVLSQRLAKKKEAEKKKRKSLASVITKLGFKVTVASTLVPAAEAALNVDSDGPTSSRGDYDKHGDTHNGLESGPSNRWSKVAYGLINKNKDQTGQVEGSAPVTETVKVDDDII